MRGCIDNTITKVRAISDGAYTKRHAILVAKGHDASLWDHSELWDDEVYMALRDIELRAERLLALLEDLPDLVDEAEKYDVL